MKRNLCILMAICLAGTGALGQRYETIDASVRFRWVDVMMDSGNAQLAAYQVELVAEKGDVLIVSIEGGEHAAFKEPAYYDPAAMAKNRVILAAFSTGKDLPVGRTRVARVHVRVAGDLAPEYAIKVIVAAGADGEEIKASASVGEGESE